MNRPLKAPFPYAGGKSRIASVVWSRLGDTKNYVEPFFGSGAMLLNRPTPPQIETVNDADGLLANFWRALREDPEAVAHHADHPIHECDLHARHSWLVSQRAGITSRLEGDPDWFDARVAGWWVWGMAIWIGGGFCSGKGPWHSVDGELITAELPHLGNAGRGINAGISRALPHLGDAGQGGNLGDWFKQLSDRLRRTRVTCGDWKRVCTPIVTTRHGLTAVFLDPPYSYALRDKGTYAKDTDCGAAVAAWAIEHGDDPLFRIALCGYDGEHIMPDTWECVAWKANGGYAKRDRALANAHIERVWFSPHCLRPAETGGEG